MRKKREEAIAAKSTAPVESGASSVELDGPGMFNVLLAGRNPRALSMADNLRSSFLDSAMASGRGCMFNVVDDLDLVWDGPSDWFHQFSFKLATTPIFCNVVASRGFAEWLLSNPPPAQRAYLRGVLQALNFVVVDVDEECRLPLFDSSVPQTRFDDMSDFLSDLTHWVDSKMGVVWPKRRSLSLIAALAGNRLSFLGDAFGLLSERGPASRIVKADRMRFDCPILFDEFCWMTRGLPPDEIGQILFTRSSATLRQLLRTPDDRRRVRVVAD